jgi:hypothetical protein
MRSNRDSGRRAWVWIAMALCAAVVAARALEQLVRNQPTYADGFAPVWLPLAAFVLAAAGLLLLDGRPEWLRLQRVLSWSGLLLTVWTANGLPFDLLRIVRLIPLEVDWPGLATRTLALAAAVALGRLVLADQPDPASTRVARWYGYAAFVLALPYPFLRTWWALGGTPGLAWPGAAGEGFAPWLMSIPWLLAAVLSLMLVSPWRRVPRRLLLAAGWFATAFVGMIGPAAFWSLIPALASGRDLNMGGIAVWVPVLFYTSWFLWAIAAAAATRSYQLRSASAPDVPAEAAVGVRA